MTWVYIWLCWKDIIGYAESLLNNEFKAGVLEVARKREVVLKQVAKDFDISITCLEKWLRADRAADSGVSAAGSVSLLEEVAQLIKA